MIEEYRSATSSHGPTFLRLTYQIIARYPLGSGAGRNATLIFFIDTHSGGGFWGARAPSRTANDGGALPLGVTRDDALPDSPGLSF